MFILLLLVGTDLISTILKQTYSLIYTNLSERASFNSIQMVWKLLILLDPLLTRTNHCTELYIFNLHTRIKHSCFATQDRLNPPSCADGYLAAVSKCFLHIARCIVCHFTCSMTSTRCRFQKTLTVESSTHPHTPFLLGTFYCYPPIYA